MHCIIQLNECCFSFVFTTNQVEASTKLYPAVFVKPTTSNMFQFQVGSIKVQTHL